MTTIEAEGEGLAAGPWHIRTSNGYPADEVISALQKAIRRGQSDQALFWVTEANNSGLGAWVWRRLFIITSEDVGLAEPNAPAVIAGLYSISQVLLANMKKTPGGTTVYPPLQLLQAAWYLSRLPKSRELADAECVLVLRMKRKDLLDVPDEALDQHTSRGRAMGRGLVHFLEQSPAGGRWIANHVTVDGDRWREAFYAIWRGDPDNPSKRTLE